MFNILIEMHIFFQLIIEANMIWKMFDLLLFDTQKKYLIRRLISCINDFL